jgi:hypothetical protein
MKTKILRTVFSTFLLLLSMISIQAQSATEEVDLLQSLYGMEKKSLISEFLGNSVNDSFWQVYDAYELERKALGKQRIDLLSNYAENYSRIKGEKADDLIKKAEGLNRKQNSLISKYTKKVRKVAGSEVAAQFYQVEHYLLSAVRAEIFENIPFIGTLKID